MKTVKKAMAALLLTVVVCTLSWADDWPQWGGRNRNFMVETKGLATSWPASGPKQVWKHDLGEGYSAIVAEGNRLYTMYRVPGGLLGKDREAIAALDATTGQTVWAHLYDAPSLPRMNLEYGPGPHSTPLIVGDRLFAAGATGKMHTLDKNTGKVLWSKDFYKEYNVVWGRGYSCSPIAYKDTVIFTLGVKGASVLALRQSDGVEVWRKHDFDYGPGSPILINVDGQEQLLFFMAEVIMGLEPASGAFLWSHPHKTDWGLNISTPVWGPGNLLFCSSAYGGGTRVLELHQSGGQTTVKQLWFSNRMRIHIGTAIRIGDHVYGSSGDFGPTFFAAIHVKTGEVAWQDRSFAKASSIYADGKLVILDEDGNLALATATPQGLQVHVRAAVMERNAWTVPTLVGTRLYVRDRKTIRCLDLG